MEHLAPGHYRNSAPFLIVNALIYFGQRMSFCSACCQTKRTKQDISFSPAPTGDLSFSHVLWFQTSRICPLQFKKNYLMRCWTEMSKKVTSPVVMATEIISGVWEFRSTMYSIGTAAKVWLCCYRYLCCQPSLRTVLTLAGCDPSPWILPVCFNHLSGDLLSLL